MIKRTPMVLLIGLALCHGANAAPILNPGNGNHYDLIPGTLTWAQARDAAAGMTFMGQPGHLATITTASENAFIVNNFGNPADGSFGAWFGGQGGAGNNWFWAVGPEAGDQFSTGQTPTPPHNYANWGGVEPNNPGGVSWFNLGSSFSGILHGQWADSGSGNPTAGDPAFHYIVEFETSQNVVPEPVGLLTWSTILALCGVTVLLKHRRVGAFG